VSIDFTAEDLTMRVEDGRAVLSLRIVADDGYIGAQQKIAVDDIDVELIETQEDLDLIKDSLSRLLKKVRAHALC
jgi:hypothetical protein